MKLHVSQLVKQVVMRVLTVQEDVKDLAKYVLDAQAHAKLDVKQAARLDAPAHVKTVMVDVMALVIVAVQVVPLV